MGELLVVRGRTAHADLARHGHRVREGALTVTHRPDAGVPRFAFAIGRRVGPAVTRNRLRRRLRALLREALADPGLTVAGGDYLVGAAPGAVGLDHAALRAGLWRALERAGAGR